MNNRSTAKNVLMEQRADIRQILIGMGIPVREIAKGAGVNVTMIGPIHITHVNGAMEQTEGIVEIEGVEVTPLLEDGRNKGPALLRGIEQGQDHPAPLVDEKTLKDFKPIYEKLPENKLDSTVRMVAEVAYRKDNSPKSVAKALNCSVYKARSIMGRFGLSS